MEQLLTDIIGFLRAVGPEVVFFVTLVETAFFIGLLVPAEATVLVAAFFVSEGVFEMEHVLLATLGGAFLGDQIGYALGRYGGRRFAASGGRVGRLWRRSEPRARRMFGHHAIVAVTLARFVSFVRTLMPWFAGMTHVRYPRFAFYDALGVAGWGVASVMAGYVAGESWHVLANALGTASAVIVASILVAVIVVAVRGRRSAKAEAEAEAQAKDGLVSADSTGTEPPAEPLPLDQAVTDVAAAGSRGDESPARPPLPDPESSDPRAVEPTPPID